MTELAIRGVTAMDKEIKNNKLLSDEELYEKLEEMHYKLENTQHTNWDEYTNTLCDFTDLINNQKHLAYSQGVNDALFDPTGKSNAEIAARNKRLEEANQ